MKTYLKRLKLILLPKTKADRQREMEARSASPFHGNPRKQRKFRYYTLGLD